MTNEMNDVTFTAQKFKKKRGFDTEITGRVVLQPESNCSFI